MLEKRNSRIQGLVGIGSAIEYFTKNDYIVSIPLTDSQEYDLIVEKDNILKRVQVKTGRYKRGNRWLIGLRTSGGNMSRYTRKHFDKTKCDFLFVLVEDGKRWLIPVEDVKGTSGINLGGIEYEKFLVWVIWSDSPVWSGGEL